MYSPIDLSLSLHSVYCTNISPCVQTKCIQEMIYYMINSVLQEPKGKEVDFSTASENCTMHNTSQSIAFLLN